MQKLYLLCCIPTIIYKNEVPIFHITIHRNCSRRVGRHFEYVGIYSNCFYIRLNGGRTYLISCDAPDIVVKKINGTKR